MHRNYYSDHKKKVVIAIIICFAQVKLREAIQTLEIAVNESIGS